MTALSSFSFKKTVPSHLAPLLLWKLAGLVVTPHIHQQRHTLRVDHQAEFPHAGRMHGSPGYSNRARMGSLRQTYDPFPSLARGKVVAKTVCMQLQPQFRQALSSWPQLAYLGATANASERSLPSDVLHSRRDATQACAQGLAMEGLRLGLTVPRPLTPSTNRREC